jgi:hypothetical protein
LFRIRHIPSGRFVKKNSSMSWTLSNIEDGNLDWALTSGVGYIYATRRGAESFFSGIPVSLRKDYEIVGA